MSTLPTSSMPHGYPGQGQQIDPRMVYAYRQGFNTSPFSADASGRRRPYQQGMSGAQQQQQFKAQGFYQPAMGPGLNLAIFLTKLAFAGGMR